MFLSVLMTFIADSWAYDVVIGCDNVQLGVQSKVHDRFLSVVNF